MADEKPKPKEQDAKADSAAAPAKKGKTKLIGIVGGIMLLEGVGVFAAVKLMGGGAHDTHAEESLNIATQPAPSFSEIQVVRLRAPNNKDGQLILWSVEVVIRVPQAEQQKIADAMKANEKTVQDRIVRIIRSAESQYLKEDGLETLRRQIRFELGRVLEDETKIVEVLVPECTPYPTGF